MPACNFPSVLSVKSVVVCGSFADHVVIKMKARDVLKIVSANEQTFEMFRQPEGAPDEFKVMEINYLRKKDVKK
ncbi:MAG: DUF1579 domain-containing protein [Gemmataceae bacterium]|nr:DUF1579 domain-containing protein [Gemmataceae bacterium]